MATTSKARDRHLLFHGELSDAPGRNESWDEYLRYRGDNRWELIAEGTDFSGTGVAGTIREVMSTKAMVKWALERDEETREASRRGAVPLDEPDDDDPPRQFGPHAARLREIAASVGATYCLSRLDGWLAGSWPPKQRAARILDIKGVTRRSVWIGVHSGVYEVDSNLGPAYLYPPGADRAAKLVLKSETSTSAGWVVKVPIKLMAKIEALKPDLESLG